MDRLAIDDGEGSLDLVSGAAAAMRGALDAGDRARAVALYAEAERTAAAAGSRPGSDVIDLFRQAIRTEARGVAAPLPSTPFFGRAVELASIEALLLQTNAYVLLHGPGGVGKTRLALRAVECLRDRFDDVRWFGIADRRSVDVPAWLENELADVLTRSRTLVVIDECEEHADAIDRIVAGMRAAAPRWSVLATSRVIAQATNATVIRIDPFAAPPIVADAAHVAQSPAAAFFLERAAALRTTFTLTDSNALHVAKLCVRLDGLPLALEMGAAQMRFLSPKDALARIGADGLVDRIAERAVASTVALLNAADRAVFETLGIFPGSFSFAQAVEMCGEDVAGAIGRLVDRSLLSVEDAAGTMVYSYLATTRDYARTALVEAGRWEILEAQLVRTTIDRVVDLGPAIFRGERDAWTDVDARLPTIRHVVTALAHYELDGVMRAIHALQRYWSERGLAREAMTMIAALPPAPEPRRAAEMLLTEAICARHLPDYERASAALERALALAEELEDDALAATVLHGWAPIAYNLGDYERSRAMLERLAAMHPRGDLRWGRVHVNLAVLHASLGEYARALEIYDRVERSCEDPHLALTIAVGRAYAYGGCGNAGAARVSIGRAHAALGEGASPFDRAFAGHGEAIALMLCGDAAGAIGAAKTALTHALPAGMHVFAPLVADTIAAAGAAVHEPQRIAQIFGYAETARCALRARREPALESAAQATRETLVERLGARLFAQEYAAGAASTLDRAAAAIFALPATPGGGIFEDLSARERDIALLVGEGLSNAEIADRLSISVRTVGNHLSTIFSKTGLTRRTQLMKAIAERSAGGTAGSPAVG